MGVKKTEKLSQVIFRILTLHIKRFCHNVSDRENMKYLLPLFAESLS